MSASSAPRRPGLWTIPVFGVLLTLPIGGIFDGPIRGAAGAIVCPRSHARLVVRVARDLTKDQRFVGSGSSSCLCVEPATERACRFGEDTCRARPISAAAAYATLIGVSFSLGALVVAGIVVALRSRRRA